MLVLLASRPGDDDEPPLQMTTEHLLDIRRAVDEIGDRPERRAFADFIIYPVDR